MGQKNNYLENIVLGYAATMIEEHMTKILKENLMQDVEIKCLGMKSIETCLRLAVSNFINNRNTTDTAIGGVPKYYLKKMQPYIGNAELCQKVKCFINLPDIYLANDIIKLLNKGVLSIKQ